MLNVGELIPRKNQQLLIRAIADISEIYLTIAGRGELQEQLENTIRELHLEERVKLLGYRNDISDLCQAADIFAFPSLQEGLSVALMEAMACGVPVITFDICAFPEFVISQISGERVPLSRDMNENTSEFLSVILYVMAHHAEYHPRQIALRYGKETVISFYREKLGLKSDFERKDIN